MLAVCFRALFLWGAILVAIKMDVQHTASCLCRAHRSLRSFLGQNLEMLFAHCQLSLRLRPKLPSQTVIPLKPCMRVVEAHYVTLPWIHRDRWKKRLTQKIGDLWLDHDVDRACRLRWLNVADIGEGWHKDEDLWLVVQERCSNRILLANFIDQCWEAVRLDYETSFLDLNSMD